DEGQEWMRNLDKAIEMRDSHIAHAFRGATAVAIGNYDSDLKMIESGLKDIELAKFRLRDNYFVLLTSAQGHLNAAILYGKAGQLESQKKALAEAKDDVEHLKEVSVSGYVGMRVGDYEMVKDDDTVLKILEDAVTRDETKELVWLYAMTLYRKGQIEKALDALDRSRQPENTAVQELRLYLIAERYGRDKAYEEYQKVIRQTSENGQLVRRGYASFPLFLGKRDEAAEAFRMAAASSGMAFAYLLSQTAAYLARDKSMSEADYLKGARDNAALHGYELMVGLARLSDGDRAGAREHLEKMLATDQYYRFTYQLGRTLLERLKNDPTWPKWIQEKK